MWPGALLDFTHLSIVEKIDTRIKALAHERFGILCVQLVVEGDPTVP